MAADTLPRHADITDPQEALKAMHAELTRVHAMISCGATELSYFARIDAPGDVAILLDRTRNLVEN